MRFECSMVRTGFDLTSLVSVFAPEGECSNCVKATIFGHSWIS